MAKMSEKERCEWALKVQSSIVNAAEAMRAKPATHRYLILEVVQFGGLWALARKMGAETIRAGNNVTATPKPSREQQDWSIKLENLGVFARTRAYVDALVGYKGYVDGTGKFARINPINKLPYPGEHQPDRLEARSYLRVLKKDFGKTALVVSTWKYTESNLVVPAHAVEETENEEVTGIESKGDGLYVTGHWKNLSEEQPE